MAYPESGAIFDPPRPFRDWFVRTFRVWPKIVWGELDGGGTLQAYGLTNKIEGLYGLSVGSRFFGGMKLKRQSAEPSVTVLCSCGQEHSPEDWRNCPMALSPRPNDPWWRH